VRLDCGGKRSSGVVRKDAYDAVLERSPAADAESLRHRKSLFGEVGCSSDLQWPLQSVFD